MGGSASGTTILKGGVEIFSGATGFLQLAIGSSITIESGGTLIVGNGGEVDDVNLQRGGTLIVRSGGATDPVVIASGASETISAGATDTGALISGGTQIVFGTAADATVLNGSQVVESGGEAVGTVLSGRQRDCQRPWHRLRSADFGGTQLVFGVGSQGTDFSGGTALIEAHGTALSAVVSSGGGFRVLSAGTSISATVRSGGTEVVSAHSTDLGAQILRSGVQLDFGLASGAAIFSGGSQALELGGVANATAVSSGGNRDHHRPRQRRRRAHFERRHGVSYRPAERPPAQLSAAAASSRCRWAGQRPAPPSAATATKTVISGVASHTAVLSGGTQIVGNSGTAIGAAISGRAEVRSLSASSDPAGP